MKLSIGYRLRAARERAGLSREALAVRAGISWSAIAQIEAGRRENLRPSTLAALADALGVTIDYVVSGSVPSRPMLDHQALLYETESEFLDFTTPFLEEALQRAEAALVITRPERVRRLRRQLGAGAKRVTFSDRATLYTSADEVLAHLREFTGRSLAEGAPWIRLLGEPVWGGRAAGDVRRWARFESLLNLIFSAAPATAVCAYHTGELHPNVMEHARATHPHTVEGAQLLPSPSYLDPGEFVLDGS